MDNHKKNKALVIYHSYSNNTKNVALNISDSLQNMGWDARELSLADAVVDIPFKNPDLIILGTPAFYWTVPKGAMNLIKRLPDLTGSKAFVFCTFGGCVHKDVPYTLACELIESGAEIVGGASILAPHSCPAESGGRVGDTDPAHGMGQPDESVINKLSSVIYKIAKAIENNNSDAFEINNLKITNVKSRYRFFSNIPYDTKSKFMPRVKAKHKKCRGCNICVNNCETGSIQMLKENKISINRRTCAVCYSCILHCPSGALITNWTLTRMFLWLMGKFRWNIDTEIIV